MDKVTKMASPATGNGAQGQVMFVKERVEALYQKKQMRMIAFGLTIAFISAVLNIVFPNFNVATTNQINGQFHSTLLASYIMSIFTLGICEFSGGVFCLIWNIVRGIPAAEIGRNWRVKSGRMIMLSALIAGPIGTGCTVVAYSLCGTTYAACIVAMAPIITCFLSRIFLKEKISGRAWTGIVISIVGALIACLIGAPSGSSQFAVGIAIACVCPIAFALEGIIGTHAVDVTDPMFSCPMYRMVASGIFQVVIAIFLSAVTGHAAWIGQLVTLITSNNRCMLFMLCTAIAMFLQYNMAYCSYNYCGAAKAEAILFTSTFWSIPVGFAMQAAGILPYHVNIAGIIGAIVVVVGIVMVVAKPSELFSLRSTEED